MSKSNASAKNRRAFISPPLQNQSNTITQPSNAPSTSTTGLTLQQVISLFDRRIVNLELLAKESSQKVTFQQDVPAESSTESSVDNLSEIIDEFNSRFELFAQEIGTMKDALLKLQTYTMDVNKTLLEERGERSGGSQLLTSEGAKHPEKFGQLLSLETNVSTEPIATEPTYQVNDELISEDVTALSEPDIQMSSISSNNKKRGKAF